MTVYVVVDVGDTVLVAPFPNPFDHEYVYPGVPADPLAEIVASSPLQISSPVVLATGSGLTTTVAVAISIHPLLSVIVTVYVVVDVGDTVLLAPFPRPLDQS